MTYPQFRYFFKWISVLRGLYTLVLMTNYRIPQSWWHSHIVGNMNGLQSVQCYLFRCCCCCLFSHGRCYNCLVSLLSSGLNKVISSCCFGLWVLIFFMTGRKICSSTSVTSYFTLRRFARYFQMMLLGNRSYEIQREYGFPVNTMRWVLQWNTAPLSSIWPILCVCF